MMDTPFVQASSVCSLLNVEDETYCSNARGMFLVLYYQGRDALLPR